jgi:hypothetical protein
MFRAHGTSGTSAGATLPCCLRGLYSGHAACTVIGAEWINASRLQVASIFPATFLG